MKHCLVVLLLLMVCSASAQSDSAYYNYAYLGFGRHAALYAKYERVVVQTTAFKTSVNLGIGRVPGDLEYGDPSTTILLPSLVQGYYIGAVGAFIGIEPAINFEGNLWYTELNAPVGLRFAPGRHIDPQLFVELGYYPTLYRSHEHNRDVPLFFALGLCF